jgi:sensor c-di-GMP phosphodiesterase-like protein
MYKAKELGKNTFRYYSSDMNKKAAERIKMDNKLRYAIKNHEFHLYYQPQYNIENNQLEGMEALIRWEDKEMGLKISLDDFGTGYSSLVNLKVFHVEL